MNLVRASNNVKIQITDFDGPLDLLLHLIREQKLDIKTVRLAQVTSQYLSYLEHLETLDLDLASEFIEVGATLIEIKGRNILPRDEALETDPEDLEQRLLARIEEYKLLKEASEKLKNHENVNRYYKEPVKLKTDYRYVLDDLSMDGLVEAFTKLLFRVERNAAPVRETHIKLDRFTVADKIKDIRTLLGYCESVAFNDLFRADFTRGEVINTFLALLELLKRQEVRAIQTQQFAGIDIIRGEEYQTTHQQDQQSSDAFIETHEPIEKQYISTESNQDNDKVLTRLKNLINSVKSLRELENKQTTGTVEQYISSGKSWKQAFDENKPAHQHKIAEDTDNFDEKFLYAAADELLLQSAKDPFAWDAEEKTVDSW